MLPRPGWLLTSIQPSYCVTTPSAVVSPNPVPCPAALVVKNGSKIRYTVSGPLPPAGSETASRT